MSTFTGTPSTASTVTPNYDTRSYEDLVEACSRTTGIEPNRLLTDDSLAFRDYINQAMRKGWEGYRWPYLMHTVADTVANKGLYRTYDIISITKYDPRTYKHPGHYQWSFDGDGINFISTLTTTTTVYYTYREKFYPMDGSNYSSSTSYSNNQMAYDTGSGDWYRSLADSNSGNAVTDTSKWDRREIPAFLFDYVRYLALADLREAQRQPEKVPGLKRRAEEARLDEIDKLERQKGLQHRAKHAVRSQGN